MGAQRFTYSCICICHSSKGNTFSKQNLIVRVYIACDQLRRCPHCACLPVQRHSWKQSWYRSPTSSLPRTPTHMSQQTSYAACCDKVITLPRPEHSIGRYNYAAALFTQPAIQCLNACHTTFHFTRNKGRKAASNKSVHIVLSLARIPILRKQFARICHSVFGSMDSSLVNPCPSESRKTSIVI